MNKRKVNEIKEFAKIVERAKKSVKSKKESKHQKKKGLKDSLFKFGPEARKNVNEEILNQEKAKTQKEFNCVLCEYEYEKYNTRKFQSYGSKRERIFETNHQ